MEYFLLNNNMMMPKLGYGVFKTPAAETKRAVTDAIEIGYRSIDTAQAYGNEEGVGEAIYDSGIKREEFFITTKISIENSGYEKAKISIEESLNKLKTDYIDLLLVHQPFGDYYGSYRAMEDAVREGKAKSIGVSNFLPDRFIDIQHFCEIKPVINQVETHVFQQQRDMIKFLKKYNCQIESWGPFAEGRNNFFDNEILNKIAKRYNKTAAQVALRFLIQNDVIVIPKSVHKNRMKENFNVFDFDLNSEEIKEIKSLDTGKSLFYNHSDPTTVEYFIDSIREKK